MPSKDTNIGAKRAREARTQLGLEPRAPLACLLTTVERDAGIPVVIPPALDGAIGSCVRIGLSLVFWVRGGDAPARQRWTLAHELGHCFCGHDDSAVEVLTVETLNGKKTTPREIQANAFAAEFLAPGSAVRELAGPDANLDDVVRIAARFGISGIAALYRLATLGILDQARIGELEPQVNGDAQREAWERLGLEPHQDALSRIRSEGAGPRIPAALEGSGLAALVRGEAAIDEVARDAGTDPARLAAGLRRLGLRL